MGRRQRSTTVTIAGLSVVSGSASSRRWRPPAPFQTSFQSTAATSKPIARRAAQKGGVCRSDRPLAGRKDEQDSCFGRRSRQTGGFRGRPETWQTSSWPFRFSAPSLNQSACWRTRPTTPTVCADDSSKGKERPFSPPPLGARHTRSVAPPISAEALSNAGSSS